MKVVQVSTSDMGGAGIAAKRLHLALLNAGVPSKLLTLFNLGEKIKDHYLVNNNHKTSLLQKSLSRIESSLRYRFPSFYKNPAKRLENKPEGYEHFSFPDSELQLQRNEHIHNADVVHLHWVADGMLNYAEFFRKVNKPVVWTLHDMNPFTGGCHHSDGCLAFMTGCSDCIQVKGVPDERITERNLKLKDDALMSLNKEALTIITPSEWLSELSKKSRLFSRFKHYVIPNIVNENIFKPGKKTQLRQENGIVADAKVILFVANDVSNARKGIRELLQAINGTELDKLVICTVGRTLKETDIAIPVVQFGFVSSDERMAEIYSMSNVFVLPSHAENFPNTIVEAFFCGVPVVASNVGGIPEQVNGINGLMFEKGNVRELSKALKEVLNNQERYNPEVIRAEALLKYSTANIVKQHLEVYNKISRR